MITKEDIRRFDLFEDLSDAELDVWAAACEPAEVKAGEIVIEHDQPPKGFLLLLEGRMQTFIVPDGKPEPVGHHDAPTWMMATTILVVGFIGLIQAYIFFMLTVVFVSLATVSHDAPASTETQTLEPEPA